MILGNEILLLKTYQMRYIYQYTHINIRDSTLNVDSNKYSRFKLRILPKGLGWNLPTVRNVIIHLVLFQLFMDFECRIYNFKIIIHHFLRSHPKESADKIKLAVDTTREYLHVTSSAILRVTRALIYTPNKLLSFRILT